MSLKKPGALRPVFLYAIQPQRADIIAGGATILYEVCKHLNIDGFTVSEKDNLEGYLYHIQNEKKGY